MNNKTYTFNPDNINIKNSFTWENASTSKDFGKWTLASHNNPPVGVLPQPTNEEMIEHLLPHMEDKGMFTDIVEWLKRDAPKKLRRVLNDFYTGSLNRQSWYDSINRNGITTYEYLCRVVYELGFRANEVVEGRMILGSNNEWVKKYFEDFPPGGRTDK